MLTALSSDLESKCVFQKENSLDLEEFLVLKDVVVEVQQQKLCWCDTGRVRILKRYFLSLSEVNSCSGEVLQKLISGNCCEKQQMMDPRTLKPSSSRRVWKPGQVGRTMFLSIFTWIVQPLLLWTRLCFYIELLHMHIVTTLLDLPVSPRDPLWACFWRGGL